MTFETDCTKHYVLTVMEMNLLTLKIVLQLSFKQISKHCSKEKEEMCVGKMQAIQLI